MRVLVTGGAGFIGSHIVDELVGAGADVRVLDSLAPSAHAVEPDYLNPAADYRIADITKPTAVRSAVEGMDAVCHQAGRVGLGVDFDDVRDYVADNDLGTAVLLRALHARGFTGQFVLAASMVVYGEGAYRCSEHGPVRPGRRRIEELSAGRFEPPCPLCGQQLTPELVLESARLEPRNVYAATKLHQEHLVECFAAESGATYAALRYHNVYGPRMPRDTPYAGVASIIRSAYANGRAPRVFEDGGQRRDFVHVTDVAHANVIALSHPTVTGAFNIASGVPHTIKDLADAVRAGFGPQAAKPLMTGEFRAGDVRHVTASTQRAADELGFVARVKFAEGMRAFATDPLRATAPN